MKGLATALLPWLADHRSLRTCAYCGLAKFTPLIPSTTILPNNIHSNFNQTLAVPTADVPSSTTSLTIGDTKRGGGGGPSPLSLVVENSDGEITNLSSSIPSSWSMDFYGMSVPSTHKTKTKASSGSVSNLPLKH
jgi:hypothetical protein